MRMCSILSGVWRQASESGFTGKDKAWRNAATTSFTKHHFVYNKSGVIHNIFIQSNTGNLIDFAVHLRPQFLKEVL
jgi:hypothetical protein